MSPSHLKGSLKHYKQHKMVKYINLAAWLKNFYDHVHLDAFVVEALGPWDLKNSSALRALRIGKNYSGSCVCHLPSLVEIWTAFCDTRTG